MALTQVQGQMLAGATSTSTPIQVGGSTVATFTSTGLGIGTTTPASGLEVKGTGSFPKLTLSDTSLAASATISCNDGDLILTADSGGAVAGSAMNFYVDTTERMRIDSVGTVMIAKTSSSVANTGFEVQSNGTTLITRTHPDGGGAPLYVNRLNVNGPAIYFYKDTSAVGDISVTGSSTSYNTSSDYRLKENIAPMTGALAKVAQLKPVTYTWKSTGESDEGFIAHELADVCPSAVNGEKDAVDAEGNPVYQGIDTSFLVATLTAAIQEQQAIITDLKARIETLEAK